MIPSLAEPDTPVSCLPAQSDHSHPYLVGLNLSCVVYRDVPSLPTPSPILSPAQSSGAESSDDEEYFRLKESYHKATQLYSRASLDTDKLCDELKGTRVPHLV